MVNVLHREVVPTICPVCVPGSWRLAVALERKMVRRQSGKEGRGVGEISSWRMSADYGLDTSWVCDLSVVPTGTAEYSSVVA